MKKIIVLVITMFVLCAHANQEEFFLQGNKYYSEKAFECALDSYQKIEQKGPAVLFNMGNCYFGIGDEQQAIAHWLQADNQGPWNIHKKVDQNCTIAFKKLGKEYEASALHSIYNSFVRTLCIFPLLWWQLLFLCVWIFSIIAIVNATFNRQWGLIIFYLFFVCSITICFVIRYKSTSCTYVLVIGKDATVRTGPADNYGIIATANCLDTMSIVGRHENWLKVHNKVCTGWICAKDVAIIDSKL